MTEEIAIPGASRILACLNYLYLLLMMLVLAGVLVAAMTLQYANGELPCPLCLLQRIALFGVCFGIMLNFRHGFSFRNTGVSMLFCLFLLIVSVRQTLLDIYPRPGHEYIGSAVFGLHMPVWSVVIAVALLTAYSVELAIIGAHSRSREIGVASFPSIARLASILSICVIALCGINFVSVVLQCGFSQCHTFGYQLLQ